MRKIIAAALLALSLSACASQVQTLSNAYSALTSATVSPTAIIVAANSFDALEATATNYLRRPSCARSAVILCRKVGAAAKIKRAILSGRVARDKAEQFLVEHPGQLGSQGLYDALSSSVNVLQSVMAQYQIGSN